MTGRARWVPAVAAAALALASPARADVASEAQLQFELGAEMYRQRRFAEALERFLASHRLVPNANVAFNIAQTYSLMSRPVEAYNWYEEHLSLPLDEDARRAGLAARDALASRVAVVDVVTDVAGAEIFVDRVDLGAVGRSPRRVAMVPGPHAILVRHEGCRDARRPVEATAGSVTPVSIPLERIVGRLEVASDPPGATVRLEGVDAPLGTTPLSTMLPLGEVRLALSLPQHVEQTRSAIVRDGEVARLSVRLVPAAASSSTLSVRGRPDSAEVLVDGRRAGRLPVTKAGLAPGSAVVEVRAPGHEPWRSRILLEAGAATRIRARLVRPDERPWPGWWWLGVGGGAALVGGGLVVGALAVSEHGAFDREPTQERYDRLRDFNLVADVLAGVGILLFGTTLVWDWLAGPEERSSGEVTLER